jgi:hypothetical protein
MLPDYNFQAMNIVPEVKLPDEHHHTLPTLKLRHRVCCKLGAWLIALGKRLTAVVPPTPTTTDMELA